MYRAGNNLCLGDIFHKILIGHMSTGSWIRVLETGGRIRIDIVFKTSSGTEGGPTELTVVGSMG
ncbi:MAG: hypothetical protein ACUVUS_03920 [Thermoproteota archaeon]